MTKKVNFIISISALILIGFLSSCNAQNNSTQNTMSVNNPHFTKNNQQDINVDKKEWKEVLNPEVYHIAFESGTERAFTGKYWDLDAKGIYYCAVCGNQLFRSDQKFASSCGWPSFFEVNQKDAVTYKEDHSFGMHRVEVNCGRCKAHLGHIFNDGPAPTGMRYCINSAVLHFELEL